MGGDGEPVLLVHSISSSSDMWIKAGFEPSEDFRFIALDVRGHGQSGKPEDPEAYGLEMVEDIARLMNHLGIDAAHVVGYSMGAEIALKFTSEHPERVRSLVAGGSGWSEESKAAELYEPTAMGLAGSATFAEAVRSMLPPEVTDEQFAGMLGVFEQHGIDTANPDTTALALAARSMSEIVDLSEEDVAAISVPVLGIVNEADYERPGVERLEGVVSDFELVLLPAVTGDGNLDHLLATLDPSFRASIIGFLSSQD
jgi:pimeloyl-ACP methyl ester carboxylesterase